MPPLPAAPGVLQVKLSGTYAVPAVWLTRFYIKYTGTAPTVAQLTTYNGSVATAYSNRLEALVATSINLTQVETTDLTSSTGATSTSSTSNAGTRSGTALPADVCMVTSYEIGRRYRGGHPRGYWPFGTATDEASVRQWSSALVASTLTDLNLFFADLVAAGWSGAGTLSHVNVSYFSGFTVITNPITGRARNVPTLRSSPTIDDITTVVPRLSFGTQRRRLNFQE